MVDYFLLYRPGRRNTVAKAKVYILWGRTPFTRSSVNQDWKPLFLGFLFQCPHLDPPTCSFIIIHDSYLFPYPSFERVL